MKAFELELKQEYPFLQGGKLAGLIGDYPWDDNNAEHWRRPAVIVVPGGGYAMVSKREGEPVASEFFAKGFQVFILTYLCVGDGVRYPEQLLELASAVDYVKKNAKEFCVNSEEIFVVGFSAGGHLTANLAVGHQNVSALAGTVLNSKPTAVGLCYPVVKQGGHVSSYINVLNGYSEEEKEKLYPILTFNEQVSEQTPPAFIWTTAADNVVAADNSLYFALALAKQGISYELHVYPRGQHGLSTARLEINQPHPDLKRISHWVDDCAEFFRLFTEEKF